MARVFITGAHGYLGGCVARLAERAGHVVQVLPGRLSALTPASVQADYVLHLAAAMRHRPGELTETNVQGAVRLLAALDGSPRIVFTSSRAVYAAAYPPPIADEQTPPAPLDEYGETKRVAEELVERGPFEHCILRPSVLFGHGVDRQGRSFVTRMADNALERGEIMVDGDDPQTDALHVWDLARIVAGACRPGGHWGRTFNVAGPRLRVSEIAGQLQALAKAHGFTCRMALGEARKKPGVLLDASSVSSYFAHKPAPPGPENLDELVRERIKRLHDDTVNTPIPQGP